MINHSFLETESLLTENNLSAYISFLNTICVYNTLQLDICIIVVVKLHPDSKNKMINDLEKYINSDKIGIDWRFENQVEVLSRIKCINKEGKDLLWDKLLRGNLLQDYSLNKEKFETFEEKEFCNNYDLIATRLKEINNQTDKVILTWFTGETLFTDVKSFIDNWESFYYPSSDDLLVIHEKQDWIIYISHFEVFQFGQRVNE